MNSLYREQGLYMGADGVKLVVFPMSQDEKQREQHRKEKTMFPHQEVFQATNLGIPSGQYGALH